MKNQMHFRNFEPDFGLRLQANLVLNRIIDAAPFGVSAVVELERMAEGQFHCSLDIYSRQGSFIADASASTPSAALERVEGQLISLIADRKSRRGGPLPPSTPPVFYPALAVS